MPSAGVISWLNWGKEAIKKVEQEIKGGLELVLQRKRFVRVSVDVALEGKVLHESKMKSRIRGNVLQKVFQRFAVVGKNNRIALLDLLTEDD